MSEPARSPSVDPVRERIAEIKQRTAHAVDARDRQETDGYDLSDCNYRTEGGICSYGCRDEPACMTDEPADGWPQEVNRRDSGLRCLVTAIEFVLDRCEQVRQGGYGYSDYDKGAVRAIDEILASLAAGLGVTD